MEYGFEGCEHILNALYDFAIENGIPLVQVEDELMQEYWKHKRVYSKVKEGTLAAEVKRHSIDVHVIEDHVRSGLEKEVSKRK